MNKLVYLLLFLSASVQADISKNIEDIFNIDINNFCSKDKQIITVDGVKKEVGCLNNEGVLDGIWFSSIKGEINKVSEYKNGKESTIIYGINRKSKELGITRLLSNPESFIGEKIRINGYYTNPNRESSAIYKTHIDAMFASGKEGIWIELPKYINSEDFNGKYILIEGEFSGFRGHMGAYCCTLKNITRVKKHRRQLY